MNNVAANFKQGIRFAWKKSLSREPP